MSMYVFDGLVETFEDLDAGVVQATGAMMEMPGGVSRNVLSIVGQIEHEVLRPRA